MRKKLFTFLFAALMSVGMFAATEVTITEADFPTGSESITKDGVTVSAVWIDGSTGAIVGNGSFSTTLGNFTKIEVNAYNVSIAGEGWSGDAQKQIWTGNASSVSFSGDIEGDGEGVTLKFTIEDPAPSTYTLQLHVNDAAMGSVAVTNLLGSNIIDNGNGNYTVPANAEVTILATPNEGYEFSGWKAGNVDCDFTDCGVDVNTVDNPLTFDMNREVAFMAEFAAVTPAQATTTVTWNSNTISSISMRDGGQSFTEGDVTLTLLDGMIAGTSKWKGNSVEASFKFSTSLGNFTRIEITATINGLEGSGWTQTSPGAVWTGDANETTFGIYFKNVSQIVFTIGEPAPATPKAYSSGTVALKDLIVGDTLMAGVTLTDDANKAVFFVENRYAMNGSTQSLGGLFSQFTSMLASPLLGDNASFSLPGMTVTPINEEGNAGCAWVVVEGNTGLADVYLAGIGTQSGSSDEGDEPGTTGVEDVQTNHVQATKFFRDGQLLIEKNGKIYNVTGAQVR